MKVEICGPNGCGPIEDKPFELKMGFDVMKGDKGVVIPGQQGNDGVSHLTYYDPETQWSFVWDGTQDGKIQISEGGYAEPVREDLYLSFHAGTILNITNVIDFMDEFTLICRKFVDKNKERSPYYHG